MQNARMSLDIYKTLQFILAAMLSNISYVLLTGSIKLIEAGEIRDGYASKAAKRPQRCAFR